MVLFDTLYFSQSGNCLTLLLHRYDRVVDVCSLGADLKILPFGDQTEVGALSLNCQRNSLKVLICINKYLIDK